ncbi:UNVERIFIED_CONTAM: hypothetical protein GTU68_009867, partial [Idotea baltica]|nr:hypothetical protein [Idotea baltica]
VATAEEHIAPVVKTGPTFADLPLKSEVQEAIVDSGYEIPTEIQSEIIPHMLDGRDVLAQSQTGTGKTAAFALPILSRIKIKKRSPQVLVLAPTRELAIQVAKSFKTYASGMPKFSVLPIYGGQDYDPQLRALRRGVHVVVGTPGRVIDHIKRGTLDLSALNGDMPQRTRERTIEQLKSGKLDILVATDVAARGLDVSRISHVINFDLPHDTESYIHRIGRTGRAGRKGEAVIFLTYSQRHKLR